jgi:hypothetical protein
MKWYSFMFKLNSNIMYDLIEVDNGTFTYESNIEL